MFQIMKTALILFIALTILTGVVYPVVVTVVAQVVFPREANGSVLASPGIGSEWIGQPFSDPKYFWGRPSATGPFPYNSMAGSGSNQATTNPALVTAVQERIEKLRKDDPESKTSVPVDLVTASGSGLDPHISQAAALYQAPRIARVRKMEPAAVEKLIAGHLERPTLGILGQTRVNVLKLNLALDAENRPSSAPSDAQ